MASEIGRTVGELEDQMTYSELLEWYEFFKIRAEEAKG